MADTSIQWCDKVWNPTRGCSRVSSGCDSCYAMRQARRFDNPGGTYEGLTRIGPRGVDWSGRVRLIPEKLDEPLHWKKPARVFVNSMSDLFHESLKDEEIARVFDSMVDAPRHVYQILTKRPERMLDWFQSDDALTFDNAATNLKKFRWPLPNIWLGVSVEDQKTADERIPLLLQTPAAVRFVSYEPALGPVSFQMLSGQFIFEGQDDYLDALAGKVYKNPGAHGVDCETKIDWLIVGGESGPGARPCDVGWLRSAVRQCRDAGVACFVKQIGARPFTRGAEGEFDCHQYPLSLKDRKGGDPSEWPDDLRVREFPTAGVVHG